MRGKHSKSYLFSQWKGAVRNGNIFVLLPILQILLWILQNVGPALWKVVSVLQDTISVSSPPRTVSSLELCVCACTLPQHKSKILPFNKFTEPHKNLWEYLVLHANIYQVKMDTFPQLLVLGCFCGETANCTCMLVWHRDSTFPRE